MQNNSDPCADALVIASYNKFTTGHEDSRLASFISENTYDEIKKNIGADGDVFGVKLGGSYEDFQTRVKQMTSSQAESLTVDQAYNLMWTGLDSNSVNAYQSCLNANVLTAGGMHLYVKTATDDDITIVARYVPVGSSPVPTPVTWVGYTASSVNLPQSLPAGDTIIIVPRPQQSSNLGVNASGYADSITLEPLPQAPGMAPFDPSRLIFVDPRKDQNNTTYLGRIPAGQAAHVAVQGKWFPSVNPATPNVNPTPNWVLSAGQNLVVVAVDPTSNNSSSSNWDSGHLLKGPLDVWVHIADSVYTDNGWPSDDPPRAELCS